VNTVTYLLYCSQEKEKENQKKRNINLRKIDKRKRKMLVFKYTITYNSTLLSNLFSELPLIVPIIFSKSIGIAKTSCYLLYVVATTSCNDPVVCLLQQSFYLAI